VVLVWFSVGGCRSEGERLVDTLATTLQESVQELEAPGAPDENARAALEHLQSRAVQMRLLASQLDDVVRTLNRKQRAKLEAYALTKLTALGP